MSNFFEMLQNPAIGIPIMVYLEISLIGFVFLLIDIISGNIKSKRQVKTYLFMYFFWPLYCVKYIYKSYKELPSE